MPAPNRSVNDLLRDKFAPDHVDSAVQHFGRMVDDFRKGDWEDATAKGGKFVEAAVKAIWVHAGEAIPDARHFSAGSIIDQLPSKGTLPDPLRLTVPRACRFVYDVASNRGARHDPTEIDPNEMDATAVLSSCAWILAEMVRYSQASSDLAYAKAIVDGLIRKQFPFFEDIDGRVYTEIGESALEVAVLILARVYPNRMGRSELIASIKRHGHSEPNAAVAVTRVLRYADEDVDGNLRLRSGGLRKAEQLIAEASRGL
jgi:hypothetical protein